MNEFIEQFLIEARELVDQGTEDLLALEADPSDRERLDSAFRAFHTLKGAAGIIDFAAMARALHGAEDALEAVRSGAKTLSPRLVGDCLGALDQVVQWLEQIEAIDGAPSDADEAADAVIARFALEPSRRNIPVAPPPTPTLDDRRTTEARVLEAQRLMLEAAGPDGLAGRLGAAARVAKAVWVRLGLSTLALDQALDRALEAGDAALLIAALQDAPADAPATANAVPDAAVRALRVDIERVDALVRLTGEITTVKTAIGHLAERAEGGGDAKSLSAALKDQHLRFDRLVDELQHAVFGIRVLPLRQVFQRFPRLVRDLGVQLGKPVRLITEGDDTEADKAIVESLFEPLLHVLRNAVDHGVEDEVKRTAAGKPALGTITLRGARQGDHVVIAVEDDGAGIDLDRVRAVAAERRIAPAETLAAMPAEAVADLVFAPGFSTARTVSDVSGRGVGMDAVRSAIERLGGRATIESRPGAGTTVRLILPFTVMMTRVMTVEAGGQVFGIPFDAVVETLRLDRTRMSPIGAARAFVLRDKTVPVVNLADALGSSAAGSSDAPDAVIVVVQVSSERIGLEVEAIGERMDVMLKPMGGLLSGLPGLSGATLLGDGRVLLVLDLQDLLG